MIKILILYLLTTVVFLGLDMVGIRFIVRPVFERAVGHLFAHPLRLGPAAVFYLFYVGGVLWFVSVPALREGAPIQALIGGMLLGLMCYGTYEMTNYAILADWTVRQVVVDCIWGMALTGFSAWVGVAVLSGRLA